MTGSTDASSGPAAARDSFLGPEPHRRSAYAQAMAQATAVVLQHYAPLERPYSGVSPAALDARFAHLDPCPEEGEPLEVVLQWAGSQVLADAIAVSHPLTMAHLHCAPLVPALAAEALISAANASMDSWDQAPAPSHLEQRIVEWLAGRFGLGPAADGIFTSGGTQSNFLGLLLARDAHCLRELGVSVQRSGLPQDAARMRILCSSVAHFSVQQSAAILGLGHHAVVPVAVDAAQRMHVGALVEALAALRERNLVPIAIAATAGTTDFGSIDPLPALADIAAREGLWLHVDAAYGGALVLSERLRDRLDGIGRADSITVDFHKLFWQPISASALLVRERAAWEVLRLHADYLNPTDSEAGGEGMLDLVTKSIQTTRRFDGLKLLVSLRTLGRRRFAEMIEGTVALAATVAQHIANDPVFELIAPPAINSIVFRWAAPGWSDAIADHVNARVRQEFLSSGRCLMGRTRANGRTCLKLTLLNPGVKPGTIVQLLADVKAAALGCATQRGQV